MNKYLTIAKALSILGFLCLLSSTYLLRSEVLELNEIRFSSESLKSDEAMRELKENHPLRVQQYEVEKKNHDLRMEHYQEMLDLYQSDYDEYVRRIKDKYNPPYLPSKPQPPQPPEVGEKLAQTTLAFRKQQHEYFKMTKQLNLISLFSALLLVGGLLFLLMFDKGKERILYLAVLALSFFFMIGPSFHSILSAIVGFLQAPNPY